MISLRESCSDCDVSKDDINKDKLIKVLVVNIYIERVILFLNFTFSVQNIGKLFSLYVIIGLSYLLAVLV